MALRADLLRVDEQLDLAGAVLQGCETQAPLAAEQHEPAGDLDAIVGCRTRDKLFVRGADVGDATIRVEAERIWVDTLVLHGTDLAEPDVALVLLVLLFVVLALGRLVVVAHRPGA